MSIEITTVESLEHEARRRGFEVYGGVPTALVILKVEYAIDQHKQIEPAYDDTSGEYTDWQATMDDLQKFLAVLQTLPDRLPSENSTGTAMAPASPSDNAIPSKNDLPSREKIEQLRKEVDERVAKLPAARQQELAAMRAASDQASDPRRTPVPHPSNDASDASPNASSGTATAPASHSNAAFQQPAPPNESAEARLIRERGNYLAQLLHESSNPQSPIDDLPPERQQALYQLVQDLPLTIVAKMIAAPEPIGWNFKTCDTSLRRFRQRYGKKLEAAERAHAFADARSLIEQTAADEQTYMDATRRLLKIRLYKNAADPEASDEKTEFLIRLLDQQRRTDIAERRVRVAEQLATQKAEK